MEISGKTGFACLLGSPVAHSSSPAMHNLSFKLNNLDYRYLAFDISPDRLKTAVDGLRELGCLGFNLTMPLKRDIIPLLDEMSPESTVCDAVNTVSIKGGKLHGTTTDGIGFFDSLKFEEGIDLSGKSMVLLGAGGAANAIAAEGAFNRLSSLSIFRRKNERWNETLAFVDKLNANTNCKVSLFDINDESTLKNELDNSPVLCNGTNVGMGDDQNSPIPKAVLNSNLHVADIIYHPETTTLMKDAISVGADASNGKYMLLYQGAASFKIWTGCDMPIKEVKEKVFS